MPLARAVLAPVPSSPRAPEPPWALPSHGVRRRRACSAPGGLLVDAHDNDLAEREEREHDQDDDAEDEDEHERAPPSAPGGGAVERRSSRVAPAGAPAAPRRHAP